MRWTFAFLKPETVEHGLVGEVLRRIEENGFKILALNMLKPTRNQVEEVYREHQGKAFFEKLVQHTLSGSIVVLIVEGGEGAVSRMRKLVGATNPAEAGRGTIRGDLGFDITRNIIHAADGEEAAKREARIFFDESEIPPASR